MAEGSIETAAVAPSDVPATAVQKRPPGPAPRFYDWREVFPQMKVFLDNHDILVKEMLAATSWHDWPESNLYKADQVWKVMPFLHTFPANDESAMEWVEPNCKQCPVTTKLLKSLPTIRTSLYSRMGPCTRIAPHRGWAILSNHVLRCHIPLTCEEKMSGLWVDQQIMFHKQKPKPDILIFDDSKVHLGFNESTKQRCVLIVDLLRPMNIPLGDAVGKMTPMLRQYIQYFRMKMGLTDTVEHIANKVVSGELKMSSDEDENEDGEEETPPEANAVPIAASAHLEVPTATEAPASGDTDASSVTDGLEKLSTAEA